MWKKLKRLLKDTNAMVSDINLLIGGVVGIYELVRHFWK